MAIGQVSTLLSLGCVRVITGFYNVSNVHVYLTIIINVVDTLHLVYGRKEQLFVDWFFWC